MDRPRVDRHERKEAERRHREAMQEIELLGNRQDRMLSEFYPYRYLASEGFIPGYNFPRLPVRTYVPTEQGTESVERPRFLGVSEFGPGNLLYHEGRQYRIAACRLPGGELVTSTARRCRRCGCLHTGEDLAASLCVHCQAPLDGAECWTNLLDQPPMRAQRTARISCEEEERAREGFDIVTAFEPGGTPTPWIRIVDAEGGAVLRFRRLEGAWLWRINRGWRRAHAPNGFRLDPLTGFWVGAEGDVASERDRRTVVPCVRDRRHLVFVELDPGGDRPHDTLLTFAQALRRALERHFALEDGELAVELLGEAASPAVLVWEATEGALGVVDRLGWEATWPSVAQAALHLLHVDSDKEADVAEACTTACYRCLLSYTNQPDHLRLDRNLVIPVFRRLLSARFEGVAEDRETRWRYLHDRTDSEFERRVLEAFCRNGLPLPDHAQHCPADDVPVQVDFYWDRPRAPGVCLFVDGPVHDDPARREEDRAKRGMLEDRGFVVETIRYDEDLGDAIARLRRTLAMAGIGG
jgi:hypothetical protein